MNPFQKNPFVSNSNSKVVGYNPEFDEKKKIENIRENMAKLKFLKPTVSENNKKEEITLSVNDKVNLLKNINK